MAGTAADNTYFSFFVFIYISFCASTAALASSEGNYTYRFGNSASSRSLISIPRSKYCLFIPEPNRLIPTAGIIQSWEFYAGQQDIVYLQIWRKDDRKYKLIGQSSKDVRKFGVNRLEGKNIPVEKGDVLGFFINHTNVIPYDVSRCEHSPSIYVQLTSKHKVTLGATFVFSEVRGRTPCWSFSFNVQIKENPNKTDKPPTVTPTARRSPGSTTRARLKSLSQIKVTHSNMQDVAQKLATLTKDVTLLTTDDIISTSVLLDNIASIGGSTVNVTRNCIRTFSHILQIPKRNESDATQYGNVSNRLIQALELLVETMDLQNETQQRFIEPMLTVEVWNNINDTHPVLGFGVVANQSTNGVHNLSPTTCFEHSNLPNDVMDAVILLPKSVVISNFSLESKRSTPYQIGRRDPQSRLVFIAYAQARLFSSSGDRMTNDTNKKVNIPVISAAIAGVKLQNLSEPIEIKFSSGKYVTRTDPVCVYWDFSANSGDGGWSRQGCKVNGTRNGTTVCHCNHLTNFAVLLDPYPELPLSDSNRLALTIISIIGVGLSIFGLFLTIVTFMAFRDLRTSRSQKVLFNLALALLCANIVFVAGVERTETRVGCLIVAVMLYYFLLVAFAWMLIEAVVLYLAVTDVMHTITHKSYFMRKAGLPAWGIPAMVVAIMAGINIDLFRGPSSTHCWLGKNALYFGFMLPVGVIILINSVLFILAIKTITLDRPTAEVRTVKPKSAARRAVSGFLTFIVLGLTWVFGFFAVRDTRVPFQYLFCVFSGCQGFVIFLLFIATKQQVKDLWRRKLSSVSNTSFF